jgi:hypothetical protein
MATGGNGRGRWAGGSATKGGQTAEAPGRFGCSCEGGGQAKQPHGSKEPNPHPHDPAGNCTAIAFPTQSRSVPTQSHSALYYPVRRAAWTPTQSRMPPTHEKYGRRRLASAPNSWYMYQTTYHKPIAVWLSSRVKRPCRRVEGLLGVAPFLRSVTTKCRLQGAGDRQTRRRG